MIDRRIDLYSNNLFLIDRDQFQAKKRLKDPAAKFSRPRVFVMRLHHKIYNPGENLGAYTLN